MRQVNMNAFGAVLESDDWHETLFGVRHETLFLNIFIGPLNSMVETFFPESTSKRHTTDKLFVQTKLNR
jgi:hypothetical protein